MVVNKYASVTFLLALSLFTGSLIQIRIYSVGFSEFFGLIALLLVIPDVLRESLKGHEERSILSLVFFLSLLAGGLWGQLVGVEGQSLRDSIVWIYVVFFTLAIAIAVERAEIALYSLALAVALVPLLLVAILLGGMLAGLPVWFADNLGGYVPFASRFIGLANNPNQIGFILSGAPFVVLFCWNRFGWSRSFRILLVGSLLATVLIAVLVQSNTVFVAWGAGSVFLWAVMVLRSAVRAPVRLFNLIIMGLAVVYVGFDFLLGQTSKGDDASGRFGIWSTFPEVFYGSPIFGYGPGSYGGIENAFEGWEFHSLLLDVVSQGGLLLGGAFILSLLITVYLALKSKSGLVGAIMVSALVEMLAHNTQRHPVFWFYLYFPYFYFASTVRGRRFVKNWQGAYLEGRTDREVS